MTENEALPALVEGIAATSKTVDKLLEPRVFAPAGPLDPPTYLVEVSRGEALILPEHHTVVGAFGPDADGRRWYVVSKAEPALSPELAAKALVHALNSGG